MRLNRDVLISGIVKHQSCFFKLLDYIDSNDGALEFPEYLYIKIYNNEICAGDDANTQMHLSLQSLIENGVFIHNDKHTGMVAVERVIVDLLRFLDVKRAKELTHFDFEQLRKRTVEIGQEIQSSDSKTQDYHDAMRSYNELLSEIHSKIKESVAGLTAQVDSVAKDYKVYDSGSSEVSLFELYERVTTLYKRYVIPCYEFINPNMEMVQTKSFSRAVEELVDFHGENGTRRFDIANAMQYRRTAITSYYKDISYLVKKLEQFSNHLERDRNQFLAIEAAYSELMENVALLRHGKQRNKYLTRNADVFTRFSSLDGLSDRRSSYSSRLAWNAELTKLRFKEYLSTINSEKASPAREKKLVPLPVEMKLDQERQILISKMLYLTQWPNHLTDIHKYLGRILYESLEDFTLADLLYGLEEVFPMFDENTLRPTYEKKRLTDNQYYFDYIALELCKEERLCTIQA
ncbi:hypothetical protein [Shewanella sp. 4_MG-2023]|uniref:hypothetical protein n=1 Tax=Shewanella sp. 4_MG-2023 TaxID=3062652 RepID=UPI0026E488B1|nr:hypothetical protein [Shewanella sp. 4_MG-2023]MDO6677089.1 hypothetical protein [Shewanella sp. 4_MG-2023]